MTFKDRIRYFNRDFLNHLLGKLTTLPFGPFAMVHHKGRKSGKPYQTPIIVAPTSDGFMIALTYGPKVDWYRNVLSAGKCKLHWHSQDFAISKVEPVEPEAALPALPGFEGFMLKLMGVNDFVQMWNAQ